MDCDRHGCGWGWGWGWGRNPVSGCHDPGPASGPARPFCPSHTRAHGASLRCDRGTWAIRASFVSVLVFAFWGFLVVLEICTELHPTPFYF